MRQYVDNVPHYLKMSKNVKGVTLNQWVILIH
jgi:hypothetical protein